MSVINFFIQHFGEMLNGFIGLLTAMIAISLIIPGDQPEKALQSIVDFLKKFSVKS